LFCDSGGAGGFFFSWFFGSRGGVEGCEQEREKRGKSFGGENK